MIPRDEYMDKLKRFKDKDLIKVVTGIRRCGKSTLFDLYIEYLLENGVNEEQIIRLNLEDPIYHEIDDYMKLYNYVCEFCEIVSFMRRSGDASFAELLWVKRPFSLYANNSTFYRNLIYLSINN